MSSFVPLKKRLAIIVPVRTTRRSIKDWREGPISKSRCFSLGHAGQAAVEDHGFKTLVAWDIPLTEGYEFELVPNISSKPGTDRFWGLRNPSLVQRVTAWRPDLVHITGWAWFRHLLALHAFHKRGIRILFRGDSHLLDSDLRRFRWWAKHALLHRVYTWPTGFLVVGTAN